MTNFENTELDEEAKSVVLLAVTAILLTAPAGAIIISVLGPRLLPRDIEDLDSELSSALREHSSEMTGRDTTSSGSEDSIKDIKEALNVISMVN